MVIYIAIHIIHIIKLYIRLNVYFRDHESSKIYETLK